jgi:hypothetical protein
MQNTPFAWFFPVPEIMFQIVSVVLQHVVVFVLCLPSRPAALRYHPDILLVYTPVPVHQMIPMVPFPPFIRFRLGIPYLFGYPRMAFVCTVQQKVHPRLRH